MPNSLWIDQRHGATWLPPKVFKKTTERCCCKQLRIYNYSLVICWEIFVMMVHETTSQPRFVGKLCQEHCQNHTIHSFCGFIIRKCGLALPLILFRLVRNSFVTWQGLVIHALDEKHTKTYITMSNYLKHKWRQHSEHKLCAWSMRPPPAIFAVTGLGGIMHKIDRLPACQINRPDKKLT